MTPVSFSTIATHPVSEKVDARLNAASLFPEFCNLNGIVPDSPGLSVTALSGVEDVKDTPNCSETATSIINLPFSPVEALPASVNHTCQICC